MKKKGRIYRRLLGSYIVILLVPILIMGLLYYHTYKKMREQSEYYMDSLVSTVKEVSDREIAYYRSFLMQLKLDEAVRELATAGLDDSSDEIWNSYLIKEELNEVLGTMRDSAAYCYNIFIYLQEMDKFISNKGAMDMFTYCNIFFNVSGEEKLRTVLMEGNGEKVLLFQAESGKVYLLLLEPMLNSKGFKGSAVAGLWLDIELLDSRIQSAAWDAGMDWGLADSQNQFLRMPDKFKIENLELANEDEYKQSIQIEDEEYLINIAKSEKYDWSYILFIPEKQIGDSADEMRNLYVICILAVMITGFWSARIFTGYHYNPLKSILDIISKDSEIAERDEYKYLESQVAVLIDKHKNYQKDMTKSNQVIRNYVLEEMLTSSVIEKKELVICREVHEKFRNGMNLVLLCCIQERNNAEKEVGADEELEDFVVRNVYEERFREKFPLEILKLDNRIVFLMNVEQYCDTYTEELQTIHDELQEFIRQHFRFAVRLMEGGCHQGISGIHQSYLEACEAEGFLAYQDDNYIRYEDIRDLSVRKYDYSFETEERLYYAVRNYNVKLAGSYINTILDNNFKKDPRPSSDMLTCLLYDIFGTLVKASERGEIKIDKMMLQGHISSESSLEDIQRFFADLLEDLCKEAENKSTYREALCQRVFEYICKNYTDPELNASRTALHFNMTPSYLSYTYKKQMGESIADTIKKMRIKYARSLLEEGMSVTEVSKMVGFIECSTFIRTFKSCTGVTPGKIKELAEFEQIGEK